MNTSDFEELREQLAQVASGLDRSLPNDGSLMIGPSLNAAEEHAALIQWFDPRELWREVSLGPDPQPSRVWLSGLRRSCLVDSVDVSRWRLVEEERFRRLRQLREDGRLIEAATRLAEATGDQAPRLICALLQHRFVVDQAPSGDLAAAAEIVGWLDAVHTDAGLPSADSISAALELRSRDCELAELARGMVGRDEELRRLTTFVRQAWRSKDSFLSLFRLEGIGGIGKSTLAAHLVCHGLPRQAGEPIVIWIDYDKLRIHPEDVGSVLAELSRQLAWALPERAGALREARLSVRQSEVSETAAFDKLETKAAVDTLSDALAGHHRDQIDRPTLIVLDTFEQVERLPGRAADLLTTLSELKRRVLPRLAVLASGRSVFSSGLDTAGIRSETFPFSGLSRSASLEVLTGRAGMARSAAERFLRAFDDLAVGNDDTLFRQRVGIPMLLLLIGRLVHDKRLDLETEDLNRIREEADGEMATAYIYGRVLAQVPPKLRDLAHPGLVLSEVSAQSIAEVIWPVVRPGEDTLEQSQAELLFDRLAQELWLVEPVVGSNPARVRHRPDLRRTMLAKMTADNTPGVRERLLSLHSSARKFHLQERRASSGDDEQRHHSLMVYHALQIAALRNRSSGLSLSAIRRARDEIVLQLEDFPRSYQSVIRGLLGYDLSGAELERLDVNLRTALITDLARNWVARRDADAGLAFARSLSAGDRELSPAIARLVLRLFLQSGRWRTACAVVEPLVGNAYRPAFNFGTRAPLLDPLLAAHAARYDDVVDEVLSVGEDLPNTPARIRLRYGILKELFAQLRAPSSARRARLHESLHRFVAGLPSSWPKAEELRLVRIYGSLLREQDPARRAIGTFHASLRRGAHAVGIATLLEIDPSNWPTRTMAQWVQACRSTERKIERDGLPAPHLRFVTVFEDVHQPLGAAIAAALADKEMVYRIASLAWDLTEVRPHDLRPSFFSQRFGEGTALQSALPTLVAFIDRSGVLQAFLDQLPGTIQMNEDLDAVRKAALAWIRAFGDA
ncbi:MAG TPA: ATP-binding protein [Allosphingosinicella sp.]|jgi:hypothetical protein|nr:ATP-binding protein [Allosphingosinicella sp.]